MTIALPSAQKALHFSTENRQWAVTAYALAFGSLLNRFLCICITFQEQIGPGEICWAWGEVGVHLDRSFRNFRDLPADQLAGGKQPFVRDVEEAVAAADASWKAPSWDLLAYACTHQRPVRSP